MTRVWFTLARGALFNPFKNMKTKFPLGSTVVATPQTPDCAAAHEFIGTVVTKTKDYYTVRDQDGDSFDMEEKELSFYRA